MDLQDHNAKMTGPAKPWNDSIDAPYEVQLRLEPGQSHEIVVRVVETCEVRWDINLIGNGSCRLTPGETPAIRLTLPATAQPRSLLRGQIGIHRVDGTLLRSILVAGWVRKPCKTSEKKGARRLPSLKLARLAWLALPVCLIIALLLHYTQPPTLVVEPGQLNLGTLWYSPPVGGGIDTVMVLTTRWQSPPNDPNDAVLITRQTLHYAGQTGEGDAPEETLAFPLNGQAIEARIPLRCFNLSNETVHVSGTISLTLSNTSARVLPDKIRFKAEFKPAAEP